MLFLLKKEVIMSNLFGTVMQILATNVNWDVLEHTILKKIVDDPTEAGKQFTAFLKNGGKVIVDSPRVISIDRSIQFDPKTFIGDGCYIIEEDEKSVALIEFDINEVIFNTTLKKGEKRIKGENQLNRLKEKNYICLDAGIFKTLWENQILIPLKWKEQTNGDTTYIFFSGTIINYDGHRCILCLFCHRGGKWKWKLFSLGYAWLANNPSAVLESSTLVS